MIPGFRMAPATRDAYGSAPLAVARGSVLTRSGHDALHLRVDGQQLTHGRLGALRVPGREAVDDTRVVRQAGLTGTVTAGDRTAGDLERGGDDAGEVLQHPVPGELDQQGVELDVGAGEGDAVTLGIGVTHDLDHVGQPLLDVLAAVPGGEPGSQGSIVQRSSFSSRRWSSR